MASLQQPLLQNQSVPTIKGTKGSVACKPFKNKTNKSVQINWPTDFNMKRNTKTQIPGPQVKFNQNSVSTQTELSDTNV